MSYHLFLDDFRVPSDVKWISLPHTFWFIARNYNDFVKCIEVKGLPIYISFDHDLADVHYPTAVQKGNEVIDYSKFKEKTGYHCAQWLVDYCLDRGLKLPNWSVHSHNVVGKKNIEQLLTNFAALQTNTPNEPF